MAGPVAMPQSGFAAWGRGVHGQLGIHHGPHGDELKPQPAQQVRPAPALRLPASERAVQVSAGETFSVIVTAKGAAYVCGSNADGELGDAKADVEGVALGECCRPHRALLKMDVLRVACGARHAIAISATGGAYVWGCNTSGQLGLGHTRPVAKPAELPRPEDGGDWADAAAGVAHSLGSVRRPGGVERARVFSWGEGSAGCLGHGDAAPAKGKLMGKLHRHRPAEVTRLTAHSSDAVQLAAGSRHSLVLFRDHAVFAFGLVADGRLGVAPSELPGRGKDFRCCEPKMVGGALSGHHVVMVAAGGVHSAAVAVRGSTTDVFVWGANDCGQLGLGGGGGDGTSASASSAARAAVPTPQRAPSFSGRAVVWIACGERNTVAQTVGGLVMCAGDNSEGQCAMGGDVSVVSRPTPAPLGGPALLVAAGTHHVVAIVPAALEPPTPSDDEGGGHVASEESREARQRLRSMNLAAQRSNAELHRLIEEPTQPRPQHAPPLAPPPPAHSPRAWDVAPEVAAPLPAAHAPPQPTNEPSCSAFAAAAPPLHPPPSPSESSAPTVPRLPVHKPANPTQEKVRVLLNEIFDRSPRALARLAAARQKLEPDPPPKKARKARRDKGANATAAGGGRGARDGDSAAEGLLVVHETAAGSFSAHAAALGSAGVHVPTWDDEDAFALALPSMDEDDVHAPEGTRSGRALASSAAAAAVGGSCHREAEEAGGEAASARQPKRGAALRVSTVEAEAEATIDSQSPARWLLARAVAHPKLQQLIVGSPDGGSAAQHSPKHAAAANRRHAFDAAAMDGTDEMRDEDAAGSPRDEALDEALDDDDAPWAGHAEPPQQRLSLPRLPGLPGISSSVSAPELHRKRPPLAAKAHLPAAAGAELPALVSKRSSDATAHPLPPVKSAARLLASGGAVSGGGGPGGRSRSRRMHGMLARDPHEVQRLIDEAREKVAELRSRARLEDDEPLDAKPSASYARARVRPVF